MLRKSFSYEYGIQILHVREANQFVHRGIVADVSFQVGMRIAPFEGSEAEHGNVQHIGFAGVDCCGVTSAGIRFCLIASVWMR